MATGDNGEELPGHGVTFEEMAAPARDGAPQTGEKMAADLEAVFDVPVRIAVVLGRARVPVSNLLKMDVGTVVELDRQRNRLILSERAAMREWRKSQKDRLLSTLNKGDVLKGIVTSIADFGAFVDLGGADGLIHLSELAWHRVEHPREIVRIGQEVEVYVMNVDEDRKRIGLSLRRLTPEPWTIVADQYVVGQVLTVVVTRLTAFGAFARMDDAIEGLIHISEMADYRINHPKEIVQEGDEVEVRIIRIDPQHRRIGLSLRQASDDAYVDWQATIEDDGDAESDDATEEPATEMLPLENP